MAKPYNPEWDRVVRQLKTHYGMYDKIRVIGKLKPHRSDTSHS